MKINKILSQHRRDMKLEMICEHCGAIEVRSGYDDEHFHKNVIPAMICKKCGRVATPDYRPLTTKYPEGYTV